MSASRKVIILGALSAVAESTARLYAAQGAQLVLAARDASRLTLVADDLKVRGAAQVDTVALDLATADAATALDAMIATLGGVDDVILAYGLLGGSDLETDPKAARAVLDVNFTSAALWCMAAAARLEQQGHGALIAIGSVAGDRGRQSNYLYGASKGGLAILMQGLAHRLARSGARAVIVKPGFIDTPMTAHIAKGGPLWATPDAIARIIRKAADKGGPVVYAPPFWRLILLIIRLLPSSIMHKTKL